MAVPGRVDSVVPVPKEANSVKLSFVTSALLGLLAAVPLVSQTPAPAQTPAVDPTAPEAYLQINSHAVLVDVIVTDKNGVPVPGLKQDAFKVTEQGKPQTVSFFEEHKLKTSEKPLDFPALPPNVYSNFSPIGTPAAVNILLLDSLNTPLTDQSYIHKQAITFLKTMKPGQRMAIFTMSGGLRYIQGFTDDPAKLMAALVYKKNGSVEAPSFLASAEEADAQEEVIAGMNSPHILTDPHDPGGPSANPAMTAALVNFFQETSIAETADREYRTLHNLQQLASFLAAFPGRKNLIWFSESFPINLFGATDPRFEGDVKKTIDLFTAARIAVYPVDARGVSTDAVFSAANQPAAGSSLGSQLSGAQDTQHANNAYGGSSTGSNQNNSSSLGTQNTDPMNEGPQSGSVTNSQDNPLASSHSQLNSDQATMDMLAHDTGGKAFYSTNSLSDVLGSVVNNSSDFYTISYAPTNARMDDTYRKIDVKVAGGKYNLFFRHGYYARDLDLPGAADNKAPAKAGDDPLAPFMSFGMPQTEGILYKTLIQPAPPTTDTPENGTTYAVEFAIELKDLKLTLDPDGIHKGNLSICLIVYDRYGTIVSRKDHKIALAIKPDAYAVFQHAGVQLRAQINVPKGHYWLRTGVFDAATHKTGTMEIALSTLKMPGDNDQSANAGK
jgi:VWFA-related protein